MRGIVIGKFYPLHLGHDYLIDTAIKRSDEVDVLVVDSPAYAIAIEKRVAWIKAHHPEVNVRSIPDIEDDDNSAAWALHTLRFLGYKPDTVFSSEPYGKTWAEAMGCAYVDVDIDRVTIPICSTEIRKDLLKSWRYLGEAVKAGLALRIVIVGAESTGTSTLARGLAKELNAPWVPEVGRSYTESILTTEYIWRDEDFYRIGRLQQSYENEIAARSDGVIVCDTNATATELWQRRYMGRTTAEMKRIAANDKADLYIITGPEIPFVQDGIRDGEHIRHRMHLWFIKHIQKCGVPYVVVTGNEQQRLIVAKRLALNMIADKKRIS